MNTETNQQNKINRIDNTIMYAGAQNNGKVVDRAVDGNKLMYYIRFSDETELEAINNCFDYIKEEFICGNKWYKSEVTVEKIITRHNRFLIIVNLGDN